MRHHRRITGTVSHGNGLIYGEVANAIEIGCKDCHGTADALPTLRTSGPAAPPQGHDLTLIRNPDGGATIWFGPKAPAGKAANWVQTMPGRGYNLILRLYGPLEPWFNKTWQPGDLEPQS